MPRAGCDRTVWPVLSALRDCAAWHLGACGRNVCRFPITFNGGHPPADACDCTCADGDGQAWARLVSLQGANGSGSSLAAAGCARGMLTVTVELGVYRCWPTPQGNAATIPEEAETQAAAGMYADAAALRKAVLCCSWFDERDLAPVITTESAIGPSGGCVGVELQAELTVSECACPEGHP